MHCDGDTHCKLDAVRAPAVMVPHKFVFGQAPREPRRMFTELHYCEFHRAHLDAQRLAAGLLSVSVKLNFEEAARRRWPLGYTCDFEKAFIQWYLVTTPEYRQFLASLGYHGIMGAAKLATDEQRALRTTLGVRNLAG